MKEFFWYKKELEIGKYYGKDRISLQEVLRLFLECSRKHSLKFEYSPKEEEAWLIYKWNIRAHEYPVIGQEIILKTRLVYVGKLHAYRQFIMEDENGNRLVDGMAQMVLVDMEKRGIKRIPTDFQIENENSKEITDSFKYPRMTFYNEPINFRIEYRDIDENKHLNNIAYLDYVIEAICEKKLLENRNRIIDTFTITYSKEITYPGAINISLQEETGINFTFKDIKGEILFACGSIVFK